MLLLAVLFGLTQPPRDTLVDRSWKFHREEPQIWQPTPSRLLLHGTAQATTALQSFALVGKTPRYVTLVVRSAYTSTFASLAEIGFSDPNGAALHPWLAASSSEETEGEDGRAINVLDGNPDTLWHSRWTGVGSNPPHVLVFDFGGPTKLAALTLRQRQRGTNAMVKGFDLYAGADLPALPQAEVDAVPPKPYAGPLWETVDLPHSARLEDDTQPEFHAFQGVVWYEKTFQPKASWGGKRVALEFEGAMQAADAWVNGVHTLRHTGGYLPFEVNLTDAAAAGKPIRVVLRLDNRDNPSFPPGRAQNALDFTYSGGLYRNVRLEVTNPIHLHDVFVASQHVKAFSADLHVRAEVAGPTNGSRVTVMTRIVSPDGTLIARGRATTELPVVEISVPVKHPKLWDLDHPNLYTAITTVTCNGQTDTLRTRFGIRHLDFNHKTGLTLNGKPLRLEGSNRHMSFPILGNAASDTAQYREAKRLKGLGLNILRLAHYPQAPAFLDACDELGLLVIDPIPGWQYFQDSPEFKEHVLRDVRETVQRDRNHPCVAIFETSLNETYGVPDDFWRQCCTAAHKAFENFNFFTGGDGIGHQDYSRPLWDIPWTGWDEATFSRPQMYPMQKGIDREYGDYEFGGEQSSSRVGRGDGEGALMLQAWNFIWEHNRNRGNKSSFGDLTWEAIDTYRGLNPSSPISKSGMLDLFRLPKPVAFFFQSQGLTTPMVHIANGWSLRPSPTKVVVFSNCDEVELRLNGKTVARQKPDHGPTTGYLGPKIADPLYWSKGSGQIVPATESERVVGGKVGGLPFSGGNSESLSHPPFTFMGVPYVPGKLEAIGYKNGYAAARDTVRTPGKPARLEIAVDTQGRPLRADGADFVFVYVRVVDANGQIVADTHRLISLTVNGAARVLGVGKRFAEAGIAPFMVQAKGTAGTATLRAASPGLPVAIVLSHTQPS